MRTGREGAGRWFEVGHATLKSCVVGVGSFDESGPDGMPLQAVLIAFIDSVLKIEQVGQWFPD